VVGAIPALPLDIIGNYFTSAQGWLLSSVFAGLISANVANLLMTYKNHTSKMRWICMNSLPILSLGRGGLRSTDNRLIKATVTNNALTGVFYFAEFYITCPVFPTRPNRMHHPLSVGNTVLSEG